MNESIITFLYELANFVVFALLFGWIFIKPIRGFLDAQAAKDAKAEETAQLHLADAEQLRQQLENDRSAFEQEMEHQRQATLGEARQESAKLLADAKKSIEKQRNELSQHVLQLQQRQRDQLAQSVANAAGLAVRNVLSHIDGPDLEQSLLNSVCQQLLSDRSASAGQITIESAFELDETARQKIATAASLPSVNGNIDYRVIKELIGGIRIKTEHGLIDNSIAGLSSFVEQNLRQQLTDRVQ